MVVKIVEELEQLKRQFLTAEQAAEALGVKPGTLEKWRRSSLHYLPYSKIGNTIRYNGRDLAALLEPKAVAALTFNLAAGVGVVVVGRREYVMRDLAGKKFVRLTILRFSHWAGRHAYWKWSSHHGLDEKLWLSCPRAQRRNVFARTA